MKTLRVSSDNPEAAIQKSRRASSTRDGVRLFFEGDELYAAMQRSIRHARTSIYFECYLLASDRVGWVFARLLAARARAGVDVRLHLDAAGAIGRTSNEFVDFLKRQGVKVRWFHRWNWRHLTRYNLRSHRKLLVVDERIAYLGGFNIHLESSLEAFGAARWRDTHIELSGPLALQATAIFKAFWSRRKIRTAIPGSTAQTLLLSNHGRAGRRHVRSLYAEALSQAQRRIDVTTPYFIPDRTILRHLIDAGRRGVTVRLLVPSNSDVPLAAWAGKALYARLIEAGIRIHEYGPRMLHAKTLIVDGRLAILGTANLDYRSLHLNEELILVSRRKEVCDQLERQFELDLRASNRVSVDTWRKRSRASRTLENVAFSIRKWL